MIQHDCFGEIDETQYVPFDELDFGEKKYNIEISEELKADLGAFHIGGWFHKKIYVDIMTGKLSQPLIPMDYTDIDEKIQYWNEKNTEYINEIKKEYASTFEKIYTDLDKKYDSDFKERYPQFFKPDPNEWIFKYFDTDDKTQEINKNSQIRITDYIKQSIKDNIIQKYKEMGEIYLKWFADRNNALEQMELSLNS